MAENTYTYRDKTLAYVATQLISTSLRVISDLEQSRIVNKQTNNAALTNNNGYLYYIYT